MVTALAVALIACSQIAPLPAEARARPLFSGPWDDLFRPDRPVRPRRVAAPARVPLPQPRPVEAPVIEAPTIAAERPPLPAERPVEADQPPHVDQPVQAEKPAPADQPAPTQQAAQPSAPPPSACRLALTEEIAIAPSIPDISGPGGCGGVDLVRLESVVLPGKGRVAVKPAAILRCPMAAAIADWVRTDIAPLAAGLNTTVSELDNFDSFECRGRNRVVGAKLSEHGHANALDVRGLKLGNGQTISLTDRAVARDTREKVLQSVCGRFTTVLGPGSDGYHEDHIHLDLAERRNGYRICQWAVYDPMPLVAPLLPAARPDEAPPREIAESKTEGRAATPAASSAASPEPNAEEVEAEPSPPPKPIKKRRRRVRNP